MSNNKVIICDIDGTIVDCRARLAVSKYVNNKGITKINYKKFHDPTIIWSHDTWRFEVIDAIITDAKEQRRLGNNIGIWFLSGRDSGTNITVDNNMWKHFAEKEKYDILTDLLASNQGYWREVINLYMFKYFVSVQTPLIDKDLFNLGIGYALKDHGDCTKDYIYKENFFNTFMNNDVTILGDYQTHLNTHVFSRADVHKVYDDRPTVVDMWRRLGLDVVDCYSEVD